MSFLVKVVLTTIMFICSYLFQVIESVKTYCQLDECAEDEELDFTQLKDVPSSDAGAEENSPTKIGE